MVDIKRFFREYEESFKIPWTAGTIGIKRLTKKQIYSCNIYIICDEIWEYATKDADKQNKRMIFKISGILINGVAKIYKEHVLKFQDDIFAYFAWRTSHQKKKEIFLSPPTPLPIVKKKVVKKVVATPDTGDELKKLLESMDAELMDPLPQARNDDITLREDMPRGEILWDDDDGFGQVLGTPEEANLSAAELLAIDLPFFNEDLQQKKSTSSDLIEEVVVEKVQVQVHREHKSKSKSPDLAPEVIVAKAQVHRENKSKSKSPKVPKTSEPEDIQVPEVSELLRDAVPIVEKIHEPSVTETSVQLEPLLHTAIQEFHKRSVKPTKKVYSAIKRKFPKNFLDPTRGPSRYYPIDRATCNDIIIRHIFVPNEIPILSHIIDSQFSIDNLLTELDERELILEELRPRGPVRVEEIEEPHTPERTKTARRVTSTPIQMAPVMITKELSPIEIRKPEFRRSPRLQENVQELLPSPKRPRLSDIINIMQEQRLSQIEPIIEELSLYGKEHRPQQIVEESIIQELSPHRKEPRPERIGEEETIERPQKTLTPEIDTGEREEKRFKNIINILITWDYETMGDLDLKKLAEKPLTRLSIARAFHDVLVLCKDRYVKLISAPDSLELISVAKGPKLY